MIIGHVHSASPFVLFSVNGLVICMLPLSFLVLFDYLGSQIMYIGETVTACDVLNEEERDRALGGRDAVEWATLVGRHWSGWVATWWDENDK